MLKTGRLVLVVAFLALLNAPARAQRVPPPTLQAVLSVDALQAGSKATVAVRLAIPRGYHIQSHTPLEKNLIPLVVGLTAPPGVTASEPLYPPPTLETYPALGTISVHSDRIVVYVPLTISGDAPTGPAKVAGSVRYQMCDDRACFRPETLAFAIDTTIVPASATVRAQHEDLFAAMPRGPLVPGPEEQLASLIGDATSGVRSIWVAFAIAFLAGVIFNAMPCVLPVLPLKAMSFYEVSRHHRGRTIALAVAFSLGIISVFAVLALLIFVFKSLSWGEQFSNPWFAWGLVILLGAMGLGMFGAFTVALPRGIYRFSPRHDTYTGNFLFGILAAVLSTPCTAPLFPLVISWAVLQPQIVGVLSMIVVGVGMASPYLLLSAFPELARRFPRVGPWSELVKQMLGFLLIGSAVFFASGRLLSFEAMWWPLVPVAAVAALYLMARTAQLTAGALPMGVASVLAVAMFGGTLWLATYMSGWPGAAVGGAAELAWEPYSAQRLEAATAAGQPVLVDFTANWCLNCKTVEATVFRKREVVDALRQRNVLTLRADLTDDDAPGWPLLKALNPSGGIPLTAVYLPGRTAPAQLASIYAPSALLRVLAALPEPTALAQ